MSLRSYAHTHDLLHTGEVFLGHLAAIAGGFVLMVVGLGLGVTMIMLPVGLVVGLGGVLLFVWGLLGHLMTGGDHRESGSGNGPA